MSARGTLAELEERRRQLIAVSDARRRLLVADCERLGPAFAWVETGARIVRQAQPILLVAVPLLGLLFARKGSGSISRISRVVGVMRSVIPLWSAWRSRSRASTGAYSNERSR